MITKKLLWLDDLRNPFIGNWIVKYAPDYINTDTDIIWVKTYNEFVRWIEFNGLPDLICFDNDLGEYKTGYDAAKWLVNYCIDNNLNIPDWNIQSSNPVGKYNINGVLISFNKFKKTN